MSETKRDAESQHQNPQQLNGSQSQSLPSNGSLTPTLKLQLPNNFDSQAPTTNPQPSNDSQTPTVKPHLSNSPSPLKQLPEPQDNKLFRDIDPTPTVKSQLSTDSQAPIVKPQLSKSSSSLKPQLPGSQSSKLSCAIDSPLKQPPGYQGTPLKQPPGSQGSPLKPQSPGAQAPKLSCGIDPESVVRQLGQAGRFHLQVYAMVALAAIQVGLLHTTYIFLAADVPYRCVIPECEASNSSEYSPPWLSRALPASGLERRCFRREPGSGCQDFGERLEPCEQWIYASKDTIVAEFGLACQEWKRTLVGTIHNIGMLVSLPILGYISDRWGRKRALILSCTLVGAVGTLKAFSINYEMYVTVEFLETIAGASAFPAAYILTIELLGQDKRVMTTAFLGIMLVVGGLSFALLAKTFSYWRTFILVVYPPSLLFLSYIYFLPESIRWLLTKGRKEEAVEIIQRAAKMNKVTLSDETIKQLKEEAIVVEKKDTEEERGLWMQVIRSPIIMKRLAICSWWWITCTFVFYGLAINSVSLAGDKYTNYMLVVSVEVVAVVTNALVLDRVGRKRTLLVAYVVCGVACVALAFVPDNLPWLSTLLYLLGKIAITQAFSGIYMYTSELFPTHARHSLLGFCSMVGRLGSIVAPQMPLLALYVEWLPSALFGLAALLAGALMMTTPETLNTRLPDTIREAEQLAQQERKPQPVQMTSRC